MDTFEEHFGTIRCGNELVLDVVGDAASAKTRLLRSVDIFENESERPGNRPGALHDVMVAMYGVAGALTHAEALGLPENEIHELVTSVRRISSLSPFMTRIQEWPRGYPGDFETIEYMLSQVVYAQPATFSYFLEFNVLASGIVQQHRNKVAAQARCIIEAIKCSSTRSPRILVLAAGGSPDVAEALVVLEHSNAIVFLVDSDPDAIALSQRRLDALGARLSTISLNVFKAESILKEAGPFDLIVAGGLFDYLSNMRAKALLRTIFFSLLQPNGILFFTNLVSQNPYRGWMRHVANWRVLERTPDECKELVMLAGMGDVECTISRDPTNLALFVKCRYRGHT